MKTTTNARGIGPRSASLSDILGTLDELKEAAAGNDGARYRIALEVARAQDLTGDQILDSYVWGRNSGDGRCTFDWQGNELE